MISKNVLPMLVLSLTACAATEKPQPIAAVAESRQCTAYPLPPADLLKVPVKTDFLTGSSQPSRPSNSTN